MTQRNYDPYSMEERIYQLEQNGSGPSYEPWNYSTSEVNTGQKWVDGKDVYCTVITGINMNLSNNAWLDINGFDATPVDTIVNITCEGDDGQKGQSITGSCIVAINSSTKKFCILQVGTYSLKLQRMVVFYTKTTLSKRKRS